MYDIKRLEFNQTKNILINVSEHLAPTCKYFTVKSDSPQYIVRYIAYIIVSIINMNIVQYHI